MKKRLPIRLALVILAGGGYAFYTWYHSGSGNGLTFSGNIEMNEIRLAFKRSGRLEARHFEEGDSVTSGQLVARLDTAELGRQREKAQAAVAAAESALEMLGYEIQYLEENLAATIQARQAELAQAQATLKELRTGSREQEIGQTRAAVEQAQVELADAQRNLERMRDLHRSGVISRAELDKAQARFEGAQAAVNQASEKLSLVREGPRQEQIEGAQAAVGKAKAAVRGAQASEIDLKRKRLERQTREAELAKARAELALIDTQLADSFLYAPAGGVILSESAEVGEVLAAGTPVATLGDLDRPWVRAYISETDLGRVRLGDPVRVFTDTYPGKPYRGRVSYIASQAEFTPKQIQTREERTKLVYRVKVDLPNPNHELKLNMPVEGEILPEARGQPS